MQSKIKGKWVHVDDVNDTSARDLKKMANKLITASMKSKIDVNVEFNSKSKELNRPTVYVTFFQNDDNFTISLYSFYEIDKNTRLLNNALELMKDSSKFKEIKEKCNKWQ